MPGVKEVADDVSVDSRLRDTASIVRLSVALCRLVSNRAPSRYSRNKCVQPGRVPAPYVWQVSERTV